MKNLGKTLINKLYSEGKTYSEIGRMFGTSRQRVHQIRMDYKSPKIIKINFNSHRCNISLDKLKNQLNKKVSTYGILPLEGRDLVREAVRKRDNYTCQCCGKKWKNTERRFDIHHLNELCGKRSKGYDKIVSTEILITLCHKCHLNQESVRSKMRKAYKKLCTDRQFLS